MKDIDQILKNVARYDADHDDCVECLRYKVFGHGAAVIARALGLDQGYLSRIVSGKQTITTQTCAEYLKGIVKWEKSGKE